MYLIFNCLFRHAVNTSLYAQIRPPVAYGLIKQLKMSYQYSFICEEQ